ncbi:MAG TPA: hypothetical protein VIV40_37170 [Kofleriaceae bacterium]
MSRILCLCLLVACGSEPSPVEKCDDLVDLVCDRAVQCIPREAGSHVTCVQQLQQVLPCGSVKAVSASYDRCMDQLAADSCPVLFPIDPQTGGPMLELPADCMSVVLTRELGGEMPLAELTIAGAWQ